MISFGGSSKWRIKSPSERFGVSRGSYAGVKESVLAETNKWTAGEKPSICGAPSHAL